MTHYTFIVGIKTQYTKMNGISQSIITNKTVMTASN